MSGRTPKDYVTEFGEYLAKSAERYMAAVNSMDSAEEAHASAVGGALDTVIQCDQSLEDAAMALTEAYSRLASDIHEFRKRALRARAAAQPDREARDADPG